jgi:heptosyltransferase III
MAAFFSDSTPPRAILVICTGRIGDVLLATPVVRALKTRWPGTQIDMLIFRGTGDALENNPDIRNVISVAPRANFARRCGDARKIWRKYDLGCALRTSSAASLYCWMAGRKRIGIVAPAGKSWIRRLALNRFVVDRDESMHVVQSGASLMTLLGISPSFDVVPPGIGNRPDQLAQLDLHLAPVAGKPLVVVHMYPRYAYKLWHVAGWKALIRFLRERGYAVVLTGGPGEDEVDYARDVGEDAGSEVINLVGKLSLGATAEVIRRAKLYVGPDTSASHVSAATGTPTITLFGPTNPVRWGPWPKGWVGVSPWAASGSGQRGNVYVLQGIGACVPCKHEGCGAHVDSRSDCLSTLDANRVIDVAAELLGIVRDKRHRIPIIAEPFTSARGATASL